MLATTGKTQPKSVVLDNERVRIVYSPVTRIHELTFKDGSHATVDAWMAYCETLIDQATGTAPFRVLINHTVDEELPFRHVRESVQALIRKSRPDRPPFYTAVLRQNTWVTGMVLDFAQLLAQLNRSRTFHDRIKYFDLKKRDEAVKWLLLAGKSGETGPLTRELPKR